MAPHVLRLVFSHPLRGRDLLEEHLGNRLGRMHAHHRDVVGVGDAVGGEREGVVEGRSVAAGVAKDALRVVAFGCVYVFC